MGRELPVLSSTGKTGNWGRRRAGGAEGPEEGESWGAGEESRGEGLGRRAGEGWGGDA